MHRTIISSTRCLERQDIVAVTNLGIAVAHAQPRSSFYVSFTSCVVVCCVVDTVPYFRGTVGSGALAAVCSAAAQDCLQRDELLEQAAFFSCTESVFLPVEQMVSPPSCYSVFVAAVARLPLCRCTVYAPQKNAAQHDCCRYNYSGSGVCLSVFRGIPFNPLLLQCCARDCVLLLPACVGSQSSLWFSTKGSQLATINKLALSRNTLGECGLHVATKQML